VTAQLNEMSHINLVKPGVKPDWPGEKKKEE